MSAAALPNHRHVVIVGGGIAGLASAYFLGKAARERGAAVSITLLEKRERLGGVIFTERCGDFVVEGGPDSFLTQKPAAIELCRELGLGEELIPSRDEKRRTYVLHRGRLKPLPEGLLFVVPTRVWPLFASDLLSLQGKLRLALAPFLPPLRKMDADLSVSEFIARRFGREVLERLAEPLLGGVYGADVDALSAQAALPQLVAMEEKYGNLWRGLPHARARAGGGQPLFTTLRGGVGRLAAALEGQLQEFGVQILKGREARSVRTASRGKEDRAEQQESQGRRREALYRVQWQKVSERTEAGTGARAAEEEMGEATEADAVIVAAPAPAAARLLGEADKELADELRAIPYNSSVIAAMSFPAGAVREDAGFGFVVPRTEARNVIACTWVSNKFGHRSPEGAMLSRCFLGGARNPEVVRRSDEWIAETARRELAEIAGVTAKPIFTRVYRWESCMPQYTVGHLERLQGIEQRLRSIKGVFLAGNAYRGVGISDCVESGRKAAEGVLEYLVTS